MPKTLYYVFVAPVKELKAYAFSLVLKPYQFYFLQHSLTSNGARAAAKHRNEVTINSYTGVNVPK